MGQSSGLDYILIFLAAGVGFIILTLIISRLISPKNPNPEKNQVYESGEEPIGTYWPSISNGYFVIAILFILFEIEVILLFPLAVIYGKTISHYELVLLWSAISGFLAVLVVGLVYAWANGHLDWMKPRPTKTDIKGAVPQERYNAFNQRVNG
jgi:NADH-quinone oxidoreductase subunit A